MAVKTNGIVLASRYKYFIDTTGGTDLTVPIVTGKQIGRAHV